MCDLNATLNMLLYLISVLKILLIPQLQTHCVRVPVGTRLKKQILIHITLPLELLSNYMNNSACNKNQ